MQESSLMIEQMFAALPRLSMDHQSNSPVYHIFNHMAVKAIETLFSQNQNEERIFGPFGSLIFPYRRMGAIDSLDLFGLDELILFSFYWANRHRYKKALDIGANIGLHSILMRKSGYQVTSYEPDITHFEMLKENLSLNHMGTTGLRNAAVSNRSGEAEFVRVLGNTTSSHLAGSKSAYGDLEKYKVKIADIREIIQDIDLIKMDVEGHEAEILCVLTSSQLRKVDILVEIGSEHNAKLIFEHMSSEGAHLFAQRVGWKEINTLEEMPKNYRDGTLFISSKSQMPWNEH